MTLGSARSTVQVGCPRWSSKTETVFHSAARRAKVLTKFDPLVQYSQAERTINDCGHSLCIT